jgi:hypothetical protein
VHRDTWPCIVTNFFVTKPTKCTNFSNLFWNEILHVSDTSFVHHQELFTVHSAMVYAIQFCRQLSSSSRMESILLESCLQTCKTYTIAECTVNNSWWWTKEVSETCRISFQNKFEKLVHLVGFVTKNIQASLLLVVVTSDTFVTSLAYCYWSLLMRVSSNKTCHFKDQNTNFTLKITIIFFT